MLRVSSLGLRCFRHPPQPKTSPLPTRRSSQLNVSALSKKPSQDPPSSGQPERMTADLAKRRTKKFGVAAIIIEDEKAGRMARREARTERLHGNRDMQPVLPLSHWLFKPRCVSLATCREGRPPPQEVVAGLLEQQRLVGSRRCQGGKTVEVGRDDDTCSPPLAHLDRKQLKKIKKKNKDKDIRAVDGKWVYCALCSRQKLLHIMATTTVRKKAWEAYEAILDTTQEGTRLLVPWEHLHRLARLIVNERPRIYTSTLFKQLLAVMQHIVQSGSALGIWQWNALIDIAGKGWRKTSPSGFETALSIYTDLTLNRPPGASLPKGPNFGQLPAACPNPQPDAITVATLLNLAARTGDDRIFVRAVAIFRASGIRPSREIYLNLIGYHLRRDDLRSLRALLSDMQARDQIGLDSLNACLWAFARNQRLDFAEHIFTALKANVNTELSEDGAASRSFLAAEGLTIPTNLAPDRITYTMMLQAHAYLGNLRECLTIFIDVVKTFAPPVERKGNMGLWNAPRDMEVLQIAYRALFLGFSRHTHDPRLHSTSPIVSQSLAFLRQSAGSKHDSRTGTKNEVPWSLHALQMIFRDFLSLPHKVAPNERLVYWIMIAFEKASGSDSEVMQEVWTQLDGRFGVRWRGRLARFAREE